MAHDYMLWLALHVFDVMLVSTIALYVLDAVLVCTEIVSSHIWQSIKQASKKIDFIVDPTWWGSLRPISKDPIILEINCDLKLC